MSRTGIWTPAWAQDKLDPKYTSSRYASLTACGAQIQQANPQKQKRYCDCSTFSVSGDPYGRSKSSLREAQIAVKKFNRELLLAICKVRLTNRIIKKPESHKWLSGFLVTRTGIEPMFPAWEASVLTAWPMGRVLTTWILYHNCEDLSTLFSKI